MHSFKLKITSSNLKHYCLRTLAKKTFIIIIWQSFIIGRMDIHDSFALRFWIDSKRLRIDSILKLGLLKKIKLQQFN